MKSRNYIITLFIYVLVSAASNINCHSVECKLSFADNFENVHFLLTMQKQYTGATLWGKTANIGGQISYSQHGGWHLKPNISLTNKNSNLERINSHELAQQAMLMALIASTSGAIAGAADEWIEYKIREDKIQLLKEKLRQQNAELEEYLALLDTHEGSTS